ncbi:MAG: hypothetical protein CMJ40_06335 [Phycisphaerae bacterium]|nr:hypothetical protein [Phycisphaerae bacterium]|tara:strand:- start:1353 stop:2294 length:942 start_codon:yes stop_codon:yes gene_type:complete
MIRAEDLTRRFGDLVAVDRVNLEVAKGSVTGFLGPNGAGKTTTMRMLCGVLTPSSGRAWIHDIDVTAHPEHARAMVGYLPESAPVYPEMRVSEYLRFRAGLYRVPQYRSAIDRAVDQCGLGKVRRRIIGQLSKGYRQRVALAAALLHDPRVLILDEPTSGLDPTQIDMIRSLIRSLSEDRAILLSTHILPEVEAVCDSIVMIAGGQILASGSVEDVRGGAVSCCDLETDLGNAIELIMAIEGVAAVNHRSERDGWEQLVVEFKPGHDPRSSIVSSIVSKGGRVREVHSRLHGLDEVFRSLLSKSMDGCVEQSA